MEEYIKIDISGTFIDGLLAAHLILNCLYLA